LENGSVFDGFSTAVSHRINQWSTRVIQLIKIFAQTDIKQYDPADDEELSFVSERPSGSVDETWKVGLWAAKPLMMHNPEPSTFATVFK
jgi:hypothetical protein